MINYASSFVFLTKPIPEIKKMTPMMATTINSRICMLWLTNPIPAQISPMMPKIVNIVPKVRFTFISFDDYDGINTISVPGYK